MGFDPNPLREGVRWFCAPNEAVNDRRRFYWGQIVGLIQDSFYLIGPGKGFA